MSRLPYRGSIALAALAVVLLTSRPAAAQVGAPGPYKHQGPFIGLITGAWLDRTSAASAEWHVAHREAKLRRDVERGNTTAADYQAGRIDRLQQRIIIDEWLIQKNLYNCSGYYPYPIRLDRASYCAIAQYHTPPRPPGHW